MFELIAFVASAILAIVLVWTLISDIYTNESDLAFLAAGQTLFAALLFCMVNPWLTVFYLVCSTAFFRYGLKKDQEERLEQARVRNT